MIENCEFFFKGGRAGVLLIHGLTGTPNEMRLLGKGLHRAGFTVYGMQLAGHCGNEQDMLQTTWHDWYASVEAAALRLQQSVDHIFVAGLSMGAVLSLKLAAERPDLIAGVGVYGPTFRYDGWGIPLYARYLNFLLTLFKYMGLFHFSFFRNAVFSEQPPYGLKDERLRATVSASMLAGDSASAGLAGNPWLALAEMMELSRNVKRLLPRITAPCLIIHASEDDIADMSNSTLVRDHVRGPVKMIVLNDSYHMITIDRERKEVVNQTITMFCDIVKQRLESAGQADSFHDIFPATA